jgi:molybdenum cofactor biosynthesis protein B
MSTADHKKHAPQRVKVAIVTVSTSRSLADDKSGLWIARRAEKEGHEPVFHQVVPDEAGVIATTVCSVIENKGAQAVIATGGTGLADADVTVEALRPLFSKELTAFSSLFAQLSFEQIDSAAILSRASAGVVNGAVVFAVPGSLKACKLACKALIFPELSHIVRHLIKG